jgi:hypothetical protein
MTEPGKCTVTVEAPIVTIRALHKAAREATIPEQFRRAEPYSAPWKYIPLSKAERKGKTSKEIEEARKIKWGRMTDTPIDKAVDAALSTKEEKE